MGTKTPTTSADLREWLLHGFIDEIDAESRCVESPIEEIMFWALMVEMTDRFLVGIGHHWNAFSGASPLSDVVRGADPDEYAVGVWADDDMGGEACILLQPPFRAGGSTYRLDLALVVTRRLGREVYDRICIDIECDGHEFHEKTKDQARRDKKRDRDIQTAGWMVARFTGSELFRDARGCAAQVLEMLGSAQNRTDDAAVKADRKGRE